MGGPFRGGWDTVIGRSNSPALVVGAVLTPRYAAHQITTGLRLHEHEIRLCEPRFRERFDTVPLQVLAHRERRHVRVGDERRVIRRTRIARRRDRDRERAERVVHDHDLADGFFGRLGEVAQKQFVGRVPGTESPVARRGISDEVERTLRNEKPCLSQQAAPNL